MSKRISLFLPLPPSLYIFRIIFAQMQELDNLMAASAQQLESAKAFYAEMHAHLKKKENSDNDSDD